MATKYVPRSEKQRSYYINKLLALAFKEAAPGDASNAANGAFLQWLATAELLPGTQRLAIRAAKHLPLAEAKRVVKERFLEEIGDALMIEALRDLSREEKRDLLQRLAKRK